MNELTLFAKRLQALRKGRDWSQPELGKAIGTSGAIIGRYERGEMTPSIDVARKLADALGVTLDYLVAEEEQRESKVKWQVGAQFANGIPLQAKSALGMKPLIITVMFVRFAR